MALYRFAAGIVSRGKGHSATAAAAYRAGVAIADERTGMQHDYTRRNGVVWSGLYAPKNAPEWASDRAQLWNHVEAAEKRKDARVAREFVVALPHELDLEQNRRLVQDFVRENFQRKGFAADVSIHEASAGGDERNIHAHIMVTTRTINGRDFQPTKDRSQNDRETLQAWRESWERLGNRHLERAGHEATLDHRSNEAQGLQNTARLHMGKIAWNLEQRGVETVLGDQNRQIADHEQERAKLTAELAELERIYALEQEASRERPIAALAKASPALTVAIAPQLPQAPERSRFAESVAAEEIAETRRELREAIQQDEQQAAAKIRELYAEPEHVGAVERMREDDRQEVELRQRQRDPAARSIVGALWQLTKTMGNTLSHVILGADRSSLVMGRQLDFSGMRPEPPPAIREEKKQEQQPEPPPAPARQTMRRPNPYARMRGVLAAIEEHGAILEPIDAEPPPPAQEIEREASPAKDQPAAGGNELLRKIQRQQAERMKELARSNPKRERSRSLEDELER